MKVSPFTSLSLSSFLHFRLLPSCFCSALFNPLFIHFFLLSFISFSHFFVLFRMKGSRGSVEAQENCILSFSLLLSFFPFLLAPVFFLFASLYFFLPPYLFIDSFISLLDPWLYSFSLFIFFWELFLGSIVQTGIAITYFFLSFHFLHCFLLYWPHFISFWLSTFLFPCLFILSLCSYFSLPYSFSLFCCETRTREHFPLENTWRDIAWRICGRMVGSLLSRFLNIVEI